MLFVGSLVVETTNRDPLRWGQVLQRFGMVCVYARACVPMVTVYKKVLIIFHVCCNMRDKSFRFINSLHSLICNDEHVGMPSLSLSHTHRHIHPTPHTQKHITPIYSYSRTQAHARACEEWQSFPGVDLSRDILKKWKARLPIFKQKE